MAIFTPHPASAGNVSQRPNPELLRRFEAERDASAAELQRAEQLRREGEAQVRRADDKQRKLEAESNAELCRQGVLPPAQCP